MPGELVRTLIETAPEGVKLLPTTEQDLALAKRAEGADRALRGLHERMRERVAASDRAFGEAILRVLEAA
jgi:hypothetical protein